MPKKIKLASVATSAGLFAAGFMGSNVHAAEPGSAVQTVVQEVLVTARRREESLQDVPLSISAIGADELEERSISNLGDVNARVPNAVIATNQFSGTAGSQFAMRGIPGVVLYLDGAPFQGGALPSFTDIERVEVLRGPQGTLFGRASIGGAIQMVTRKPSDKFYADTSLTLGNFSRVDVTGNINIPITDTLFVKATGQSLTRDGYVSTKLFTKYGSQDDKVGKLDVLWRPSESFETRVQYSRQESSSTGSPVVNLRFDAVCDNSQAPANWFSGGGVQIFFAPNSTCLLTTVDLNPAVPGIQPYSSEFQSYGAREEYRNTVDIASAGSWQVFDDVRLDATWTINDTIALRALGSRRWGELNYDQEIDATGLDLWVSHLSILPPDELDLRTGELQLLVTTNRLVGTTGVYWEENPGQLRRRMDWINNDLAQSATLAAAANAAYPGSAVNPLFGGHHESGPQFLGLGFIPLSKSATEQWAAFSEWTLSVTDRLRLTAGIRYSEQETTRTSYRSSPFPAQSQTLLPLPATPYLLIPGGDYFAGVGTPTITKAKVNQWTPRASLQYAWTPDVMTYVTWSKGASTNAGLVEVDETSPEIIALGLSDYRTFPQEVNNYELGIRADLFNGSARVNATLYYDDFKNYELSEELLPGQLFNANADVEIKGMEVEGRWLATDALTINLGAGWTDAEFVSLGSTRNLELSTPLALTPEFGATLGVSYRWGLSDADLTLNGEYAWQDKQESTVDRVTSTTLPAFGLLSGRLTYRPNQGSWQASLSGTNLLDEFVIRSAFTQPQQLVTSATVGRPREYAVNFQYNFE